MHRPRARQEKYLRCRQRPSGRRRPPGVDRARFWAWRHGSEGASIGRWTPLLGRAGMRRNAHFRYASFGYGWLSMGRAWNGPRCTACTGQNMQFSPGKSGNSRELWWSIRRAEKLSLTGVRIPPGGALSGRGPARSVFCGCPAGVHTWGQSLVAPGRDGISRLR